MKTKAFTLAEVLITLGIIGIVSAMTLPTLIQNKTNKELQTALKKNYSVLQAALNKASFDNGETITPKNSFGLKVKPLLMKQLKFVKDCMISGCVPHSTGETENGEVIPYVIKNYKTYNKKQIVSTIYFDDGQFMLNDGTLYMLENPNVGELILITIDINGMSKKTNIWGHDLFTFQIMNNGKLLPMGAKGTRYQESEYCSPTSNNRRNGIACTYKAITDKNYWKNLP